MNCKYGLKKQCNHTYDAYSTCGTPMGKTLDADTCLECCLQTLSAKIMKLETSLNCVEATKEGSK